MSSDKNNQINNQGENTTSTNSIPVELGLEKKPMGHNFSSASNLNLPPDQEQSEKGEGKNDAGNDGASFDLSITSPTDDPNFWKKRCSWLEGIHKGLGKEIETLKGEKEALKGELEKAQQTKRGFEMDVYDA